MKTVEESRRIAQKTGCLGWIFGIGNLLIKISEKLDKKTLPSEVIKTTPPHQAITGADLKYTHPEQIPSQTYYSAKEIARRATARETKQTREYTGHDRRGG